jgi:alkylation response protein AidB-like acyl-CoA dehydrogenase
MDFNFSEQQTMIRTGARRFLANECPKTRVRELERDEKGYDPQVWRAMAGMGWMGLVLPEEYGGAGAGFMDLVVLMEEMGRNILPGPFFSTVALCALPILDCGSDAQKAEYLPPIAAGDKVWSLAVTESSGSYSASAVNATAKLEAGSYVLNGEKLFVPYANAADFFLVVAGRGEGKARAKGPTCFIVDARTPGIEVEGIPTLTGEKMGKVVLKDVRVSKEAVLGREGKGWDVVESAMRKGTILKCAEVSGACQAVLDMATNYAKERIQFEKPIGSFQVIQHKLVDMFIDMEGLQFLVYQAAWLLSEGAPCDLQIAMAKAKANDVHRRIALGGVKIHGAIGFTMDHDVGLYYRRVPAAEVVLGDADFQLERIAASIGL